MARSSYFKPNDPPAGKAGASGVSERSTRQAWESFVSSGRSDEARPRNVREPILDSWRRSAELGIDASGLVARKIADDEEIYQRRERNASLRRAALAAFRRLEPYLKEAKTILILADDQGVIIDAIGDESVLDEGQSIHLEVGGDWTESSVGTNGIGTALKTGLPIYVHASEHFVEGVQSWTCAGVPIRDPMTQAVVGVVDLSGPPQIFQQHNIALVLAAAREIEIALAEQQRQDRTQLLEAFLMSERAQLDNKVLLLDRNGRILFRRGLDDKEHPAVGSLALGSRLLPKLDGHSDQDLVKLLPPAIEARGLELLYFDGANRGAALFLKTERTPGKPLPTTRSIKPRRDVAERRIDIVGSSPKMVEAMELAERAAHTNVSVLILGETGVGKELFARLVHGSMPSEKAPYVPVNCAAVSNDLIGAELFGYVDGAFTGATRGGRPGKFELANGGVLCLDEIGDMPIELQPYLLRALEQRAIYRMGDNQRRPVDVKLVSITNRDLRQEIDKGKFRRDLFYRISVVTIEVPPLRERGEDVLGLCQHFAGLYAAEFNRPALRFADAAMERLLSYPWPGNVRELRNLVQRSYLMVRGDVVTLADLPAEIREDLDDPTDESLGNILKGNSGDLESIEAGAIRRAMIAEGGNLTRVAAQLGISRPTLYRKLKNYRIGKP